MTKIELNEYRTLVTSEQAAEWLERNTHNRREKPAIIDQVSKALLLGEFVYNGEAIKFDWDGVLLDGQNRLRAIVATGIPAELLIVEGLPPETQDTMDTGAARKLADVLELRGETSSNNLAATINLIHVWEANGMRNPAPYRPTIGQAVRFLEEHPEIRDAVRHGQNIRRRIPLSATIISACWYKFSQIDEEDNRNFWTGITDGFYANGQHVAKNSGPYLISRYLDNRELRKKQVQYVKHALVIKGWNLFRNGLESAKLLSFKASTEQFPEPI